MQDLFGNEIPEQQKKTDEGFEEFWSAYPKCFRKGEKASCKKKWAESYYFSQKHIILKHVQWMATTAAWLKDNGAFIPAPKVYLNQQRWDGADVPDLTPKPLIDPALEKIKADDKKAVPPSLEVLAKMAQLRKINV